MLNGGDKEKFTEKVTFEQSAEGCEAGASGDEKSVFHREKSPEAHRP